MPRGTVRYLRALPWPGTRPQDRAGPKAAPRRPAAQKDNRRFPGSDEPVRAQRQTAIAATAQAGRSWKVLEALRTWRNLVSEREVCVSCRTCPFIALLVQHGLRHAVI